MEFLKCFKLTQEGISLNMLHEGIGEGRRGSIGPLPSTFDTI